MQYFNDMETCKTVQFTLMDRLSAAELTDALEAEGITRWKLYGGASAREKLPEDVRAEYDAMKADYPVNSAGDPPMPDMLKAVFVSAMPAAYVHRKLKEIHGNASLEAMCARGDKNAADMKAYEG